MSKFSLTSSEFVLKTPIFDVTHDRAVGPGNAVLARRVIRHPGASVILALDAVNRVLLIRQYRLPLRKYLWELPAGRIDVGETPLQAAKRELKEETGYRAARWQKLCRFWTAPGFCNERISAYIARGVKAGKSSPEPYELIEARWVEYSKALEMITNDHIEDAKTILALLLATRRNPQLI